MNKPMDYQTRRAFDVPSMSKRDLTNALDETNKKMLMDALVKKFGRVKAEDYFEDYYDQINKFKKDQDKKDYIRLVLGE